jgi:nicotinate dehydrogenase subunit B
MEDRLDLEQNDSGTNVRITRREFLKVTGSGIFLYFTIGDMPFLQQEGQGRRTPPSLPTDFNAFLKIGEDGRVSCYTGKIEMGQGPITSLAQELADELDVSLENIDMVMGDTDVCPWDMGTFGSMTTRFFGPALRKAGAEARMVLLDLASENLKVPPSALAVANGEVFVKANAQRRISYADMAKGKRIDRNLTLAAVTKAPADFKIMGKSVLRMDARDKVTGKAKYAGDIRLPGMLYAKILRPPAHGAKLVEIDLSEARKVEDVVVLQDGDFIAVLHQYPDVAEAALSKIKARFDVPKSGLNDSNIFEHLLKVAPEGQVVSKGGNLQEGEQAATAILEATYLDGYKAHAPMEPHAAVVQIEGNKATVWPSSQTPFPARVEVAKELGFREEDVRIVSPFLGGGFGGKSMSLQAVEAARCAKLSGKPVQVAWSRKEEFFYDTFRPAAVIKIRSGITGAGKISSWDYHVYFAGERGAPHFYDIPHHSTVAHNSSWVGTAGTHPFATGPWRAPGNNTNTFARESQIDVMAAKAGVDPVQFRMQNLAEPKMKRVLQAAAEKFGWKPAKAPSGRGYGVACGFDAGTYVAAIAEVAVEKSSGDVKIKRVVCAQDMGLVINPEGATIQIEGCITMGLGYALKENVRFNGGEVLDVNFGTYELPRFSWLPTIEAVLIDDKGAAPQGGGEPAIVIMGAMVANAIFDAVGARLFQLPLTAERVREAMK